MSGKPFAVALAPASSLANHTGSWRTTRPAYVSRTPPCNHGCPAGEDIQGWLSKVQEGDHRGAWEQIMRVNPLPAIMGRVCYHPCEAACNRGELDEAVGINAIERFLGDEAIREGWAVAPGSESGKRVLVVGSGPSGLSAAYHLRRMGHAVEIRESEPDAGGMMRYGIPKYRLPRAVLDAEIHRIQAMGVTLRCSTPVDDIQATVSEDGFDACFVAIGAHLARRVEIPTPDASRILDALQVLHGMESTEPPRLGRRVVVYGGGNTALDLARTARRLGAEEALVVYRRTQAQMPAHDFELQEALDEGVQMRWLSTIHRIEPDGEIEIERMRLDASGKAQPTGEFETIGAGSVVLAIGQDVDTRVLGKIPGVVMAPNGTVTVDRNLMTGAPGIFAGGDMVPAERSVTVAVGHGRNAAASIDGYLRGEARTEVPEPAPAGFEQLNTWYYPHAARGQQPQLEGAQRTQGFAEIRGGFDADTATSEAQRCLSCGNCFGCDTCYGVCPDNAVIKLGETGHRYEFNLDFCKGCGICAHECPCGAIEMLPETP